MKKVKRYLAVLLVTCLFISMLVPTETGAEETEAETIVSVSASSLKNNGYDAEYEYAVVSDNQPVVSENTELDMENSVSDNDPDTETVKILFVGNSFTRYPKGGEYCSVPKQLKELARLTGKKIKADCVANGKAKLLYYTGKSARYMAYYQQLVTKLLEEDWDYVVAGSEHYAGLFS